MTEKAQSSLQQGNLEEALASLMDQVRNDPSNAANRVFLFQLLAVSGDYARALTQLNVAAELDPEALLMAQAYRELLQCEGYRASVFAGAQSPLIFGEPAAWIGQVLQALEPAAAGDGARARQLADNAFDQAPAVAGRIDEQQFEWLADADMRLGPIVEAMINGKYYWVPCDAIAEIKLEAPVDLRDLVWLPAEFTWQNGGESVGFIPGRYPGQITLENPLCALARKTEWHDCGEDYYIGAGQRMLSTDQGDHPLFECRHISFDAARQH